MKSERQYKKEMEKKCCVYAEEQLRRHEKSAEAWNMYLHNVELTNLKFRMRKNKEQNL